MPQTTPEESPLIKELSRNIKGIKGRKRVILSSTPLTIPGTIALVCGLFYLVDPPAGLDNPHDRLVYAVQWLLIAMLPYVVVCLTIASQRFLEGSHNPLLGEESETLAIHCRVMQNHLEQLVWFALASLALSTFLEPDQVHLIPILTCTFVAARLIYWRGYLKKGTIGRAYGVQITFSINILILLMGLLLLFRSFL